VSRTIESMKGFIDRIKDLQSSPALVIHQYDKDTVYSYANMRQRFKSSKDSHKRGEIKQFSWASRRRARLVIRNVSSYMRVEAGLTYPKQYAVSGEETKKHLHALMEWLRRRNNSALWMLEFQKRGAPHYHLLLQMPIPKDELANAWYRIVGSKDPKHLKHGTHIAWIRSHAKTASYFSTYMTKVGQKQVPDNFTGVGRFWGYTKKLLRCQVRHINGDQKSLLRLTRQVRKWYAAQCRSWGFKWKFRGRGWTCWDHGRLRESNDGAHNEKVTTGFRDFDTLCHA